MFNQIQEDGRSLLFQSHRQHQEEMEHSERRTGLVEWTSAIKEERHEWSVVRIVMIGAKQELSVQAFEPR